MPKKMPKPAPAPTRRRRRAKPVKRKTPYPWPLPRTPTPEELRLAESYGWPVEVWTQRECTGPAYCWHAREGLNGLSCSQTCIRKENCRGACP
jgi:hypothetical protein